MHFYFDLYVYNKVSIVFSRLKLLDRVSNRFKDKQFHVERVFKSSAIFERHD